MPEQKPTTAAIPSEVHGAHEAPVIYFDEAPAFGVNPSGVASVMLCALIHEVGPDNKPRLARKAVAQLRGSLRAFHQLLGDVQQVEALLQRPEGPAN